MGIRHHLLALVMAAGLAATGHAESYNDKLASTDTSNPDSLLELALWCRDNGYHSSANKHFKEILDLAPDHAPTREALGYVWTGREWKHERYLGGRPTNRDQDQGGSGGGGSTRVSAGPGPRASDIEWDLSLPRDPDTDGIYTDFLDGIIRQMARQDNWSMEANWRTLIKPEQRASGISRLAHAMKEGAYTDLYAPSMIVNELMRQGDRDSMDMARSLLPFLMHASAANKDSEDLYTFAYTVAQLGDKRVVPRLIELLKMNDEDIQFGARAGLANFMMVAEDDITPESAQEWWDRYHGVSDSVIYIERLGDRDPTVRLGAIRGITATDWDPKVMPVLIELVRNDDKTVFLAAARELERITGNNWGLDSRTPPENKAKIAEQLDSWWAEERGRFTPIYLRTQDIGAGAQAVNEPQDLMGQWVAQLGDLDSKVSANAFSQLRGKGDEAIPALIDGLGHSDGVVRNKARDLLREMSGQNFGYQGLRGSDAERASAIERWRAWAVENGHLGGE